MTKHERAIIQRVAQKIERQFAREQSGHDWYHMLRVWRAARYIAKQEKANQYIVELGALLHDIADAKFHHGDHEIGPRKARTVLKRFHVDATTIDAVAYIVGNVSFSKAGRRKAMRSLEGKVVQDADRLEALGAIGIARLFAYGGHRGRPIFDPRVRPFRNMPIALAHKGASSLHHFYEKILNVRELMNTKTGKRLAKSRHNFIEQYLKQFFVEWEGKDLG